MAYYRLYFMDPRSGHIQRFEEYEAPGDAEAIERADLQRDKAPMELWSGCKKVYRVEPIMPGAAAVTGKHVGRLSLFGRG